MKIDRIGLYIGFLLVASACGLLDSAAVWGQKKKAPPPANTQNPTITVLTPSGVQRGQTAELTVTGTQLLNPTGATIGIPAKITIPTADKNGEDATKFKVKIEIPADMPMGWYPLRVATGAGVSNLRVLSVDDLPQLVSAGANRSKLTAQSIPVPCTVGGSAAVETADYYKITVKAGQQLSFDCQARRIGSAIDAQMSIYDAKSMREVAFDNDSPGCHTDPRIRYTFKEAGDYLLEIKDVLNRGGVEFFYRIRIGDFPLASTALPMGIKRGTKAKIEFAGPAVDGVAPVEVTAPSDPAVSVIWVAPKGPTGLHGWPVPVMVSDFEETLEKEPNNNIKEANRIAIPGGVTGRFLKSDDSDFYLFAAKKGQKLAIEAQTLEYYAPTLLYMIVRNAKTGAEVAKNNPALPSPGDQKIDFTPPDDGDFALEVTHLHFAGGPSESYHITIRPPSAGFDVNLTSDRFDLSPGGAAAIPVQIVRKGYTGPIELSVVGQPNLSGTASIKAGKNAALLLVSAKPEAPMGVFAFRVLAKATIDGKEIAHAGSAKAAVGQQMNGLNYPPPNLPTHLALAVKEKAPFTLAIKMDPPEGLPGGKATVTITATREKGFEDEITFTPPTGLPPPIPAPKTVAAIGKGKTETSFPLDLNAKTALGEYFILVNAKAKFMGKEVSAAAPPLLLVLGAPFDLQVDPQVVSLLPGEKGKVKVTAVRRGGYKGPIALDVRGLPANVTGGKATIADGKTEALVEISVDAKAAPGQTLGVTIGGTATALNNLQNVSPTFSVNVLKK